METGVFRSSMVVLSDDLDETSIIDFVYEWLKLREKDVSSFCIYRPLVMEWNNQRSCQCDSRIKLHRSARSSVVFSVWISQTEKGIDESMIPFYHYYGRYQVYPIDECAICMENECQVMDAGCGHQLYCLNCYLELVRSHGGSADSNGTGFALDECPICRKPRRQLVYQRSDHELDLIQIPR